MAYRQWRSDVEADEARLLAAHGSGPLWSPVPVPDGVRVLPVYGGTPGAVENVVTTLVMSGLETDTETCRVVNLSGWDVSGSLRAHMTSAKRNKAQFDEVGPRGSSVNLFGNPDSSQLVAMLVDALRISAERASARQSQQEQQELERVIALLATPVSLDRIADAVDVALGNGGAGATLSASEIRQLQDFHSAVVSQRRATMDRLSDLHMDLLALRRFGRSPGRTPLSLGAGRTSVRWYDVVSGSATAETELGRQLLARAVLQTFSRPGRPELLVVVGAERLSAEVLDEMVSAAYRPGKQVALLFTSVDDAGQRLLGYAGSSLAVFMRLPNAKDAAVAADFIGREYTFVVNGVSIAEGRTEDWSQAYGTTSSTGTSRSSTSGSNHGFQGGAFSYGRSVGSSVTRSFDQGTSTTSSSGGSSSTTTTRSVGRVHDYVVEPEVFQQMPDDTMLVVSDGTATLVSCENALRRSKRTASVPLVSP